MSAAPTTAHTASNKDTKAPTTASNVKTNNDGKSSSVVSTAPTGGATTAASNPNAGYFEVKSPHVTYSDDEITCK
jgi:hypothetical protein